MKYLNEAKLENIFIVFAAFFFLLIYLAPNVFSNLLNLICSLVSSGNPATNLKIIFTIMSIIILIAIIRILIHFVVSIIKEPLPPNYWLYDVSSNDD